jgi:hypothetical protein
MKSAFEVASRQVGASMKTQAEAVARRSGPRALGVIKDFLHGGPILAFGSGSVGFLARIGQPPPLLRRRIGGHFASVGGEIRAVILPVGEEEVLRLAQKDRKIVDIARGDGRKHARLCGGVERFVFGDLLGPQPIA